MGFIAMALQCSLISKVLRILLFESISSIFFSPISVKYKRADLEFTAKQSLRDPILLKISCLRNIDSDLLGIKRLVLDNMSHSGLCIK